MSSLRHFIPVLIVGLMRLLALTLRWRVEDLSGALSSDNSQRLVCLFWHNRALSMPLFYRRYGQHRSVTCLTSASKDGDIIAGIMPWFGMRSVRGSSSRRGATVMREMVAILESGTDIAITPDGPRGPRYQMHMGAIKLAQLTGASILALQINYSRYWELKSWDRFQIPKPFSTISFRIQPLVKVPAESDDVTLECLREQVEQLLDKGESA